VVSLLSGGIDSSTLLYWLKHQGYEVKALTIIYGQRHEREIYAARKIAYEADVEWRLIDISGVRLVLRSALTSEDIPIPEVPEDAQYHEALKSTVVPNRNMIFLSIAAAWAASLDYDAVAYAAHWSDRGVYPDCREKFVEAVEKALRLSLDHPGFRVLAPFVRCSKAEIVALGSSLGVPYEYTWSCYKGLEKHCGICSSCRERKRAFKEAGVHDPTEYMQ